MIVLFSFSAGQRCQTDIHCVSPGAYSMPHSPCLATHSHAPCCLYRYFCLFKRQKDRESKNEMNKEMSSGLSAHSLRYHYVFKFDFAVKHHLLLIYIPGLCEFCKATAWGG